MPRDITTTVYKLAELGEAAKAKAIENVAAKLGGDWWDQSDIDQVSETMIYTLAGELLTPGWNTYGEGDFPGIPKVSVTGWDIERGQFLSLKGSLTRETAPALPWHPGMGRVTLTELRHGTRVEVEWDDMGGNTKEWNITATRDMIKATEGAIAAAWTEGRDQAEYMSGTEYAAEWIEANEPEFTMEGELYL
jgi:hypothetical protein